jgi:hypothetical protein
MLRGVFGVRREGDSAVGGQEWLAGSAADFRTWSRAYLEQAFPLPPRTERRSAAVDSGVIHVRKGKSDSWNFAIAFHPRFSSVRDVPMWIVARVGVEDFRNGMLLAPIVSAMIETVAAIERGGAGGDRWFEGPEVPRGEVEGVEDFRRAFALRQASLLFHDAPSMRGLQVLVEAELKSQPAGHQCWISLDLSGSGRLAASEDPAKKEYRFKGSIGTDVSPLPPPLTFRGVPDADLVGRRAVIPPLAEALRKQRESGTGQLPDLVDVPVDMLPRTQLYAEDYQEWSRSRWADRSAAEREIRDIVGEGKASIASAPDLLACLLSASPVASEGDVSRALAWLRELRVIDDGS